MKKPILIFILLFYFLPAKAQKAGELYFNYDELVGIQIESLSELKVHYNLKGKPGSQPTEFTRMENGIRLGKLTQNANPNLKKLSGEPLEFIDGNLYLPKYRMFFYSAQNRKLMENRDCYIVNNQVYFAPRGKVKGKLKRAIKNLKKESLQTFQLDSKTTYDKYGIHCLGATEILGIPKK